MLGYLVAGVIIGPGVLSLISGSKQVNNIAELGVVFLLFTIGLELSVDRLKVIRNQIFGVGTAQVVVTSVIIALIAWSVGFTPQCAVIIGGGLALSSTAVVLQLLSERGELASRRGRRPVVGAVRRRDAYGAAGDGLADGHVRPVACDRWITGRAPPGRDRVPPPGRG